MSVTSVTELLKKFGDVHLYRRPPPPDHVFTAFPHAIDDARKAERIRLREFAITLRARPDARVIILSGKESLRPTEQKIPKRYNENTRKIFLDAAQETEGLWFHPIHHLIRLLSSNNQLLAWIDASKLGLGLDVLGDKFDGLYMALNGSLPIWENPITGETKWYTSVSRRNDSYRPTVRLEDEERAKVNEKKLRFQFFFQATGILSCLETSQPIVILISDKHAIEDEMVQFFLDCLEECIKEMGSREFVHVIGLHRVSTKDLSELRVSEERFLYVSEWEFADELRKPYKLLMQSYLRPTLDDRRNMRFQTHTIYRVVEVRGLPIIIEGAVLPGTVERVLVTRCSEVSPELKRSGYSPAEICHYFSHAIGTLHPLKWGSWVMFTKVQSLIDGDPSKRFTTENIRFTSSDSDQENPFAKYYIESTKEPDPEPDHSGFTTDDEDVHELQGAPSDDPFDRLAPFKLLEEMQPPTTVVAGVIDNLRREYPDVDQDCPLAYQGVKKPWCSIDTRPDGTKIRWESLPINLEEIMRVATLGVYAGDDGIFFYITKQLENREDIWLLDSQAFTKLDTITLGITQEKKRRWVKRFQKDIVLGFRNIQNNHWQAFAVSTKSDTLRVWDSWTGISGTQDENGFQVLKSAYKVITDRDLSFRISPDSQAQFNAVDCGIHALITLLCYTRGIKPPSPGQIQAVHVNNVRTHVAYELYNMQNLGTSAKALVQ